MIDDIFCKSYINWKKEGKILFENKYAYSILSVTPALPLHSIIITKRHIELEKELKKEEAKGLFDAINKTFEELKILNKKQIKTFYTSIIQNPPTTESIKLAKEILIDPTLFDKPIAYNLGANVGEEAGQLVNHFHIHLFPVTKKGKGIVSMVRRYHQTQ